MVMDVSAAAGVCDEGGLDGVERVEDPPAPPAPPHAANVTARLTFHTSVQNFFTYDSVDLIIKNRCVFKVYRFDEVQESA